MSIALPCHREAVRSLRPGVLAGCAGAVLLVELVGLSMAFDLKRLIGSTAWWAKCLLLGPTLVRLMVTTAFAAVVFCWSPVRGEIRTLRPEALVVRGRGLVGALLLHSCGLFGLCVALGNLLNSESPPSPGSGFWFMGFVAAGCVSVASLVVVALPPRLWFRLASRCWPSLTVAAVVGLAAWGGGLISTRAWEPLSRGTLWLVQATLGAAGVERVYVPEALVVGTPSFSVEIAPQCSGYEGVGLVLAFVGGYLWLFRSELRFPWALLLLPLGAGLIWVANVGRITTLILIGSAGAREVALGGFHSQAGWLTFNAVALGTIALARWSALFRRNAPSQDLSAVDQPRAAPLLVPFLAVVAAGMITGIFTEGGADLLYGVRLVVAGLALWAYWNHYPSFGWSWSWVPVGLGLLVFVVWVGMACLFSPEADSTGTSDLAALPRWALVCWLVARLLGGVFVVPVVEEMAFRGYLLPLLRRGKTKGQWNWFAAIASSVVFGLLHPDHWVAGMIAGLVYAWAYARRNRLADAIVAHVVTNATLAAYVFATGRWELW